MIDPVAESISQDHLDILTFTLKAVEEAARQMERAQGARESIERYLVQAYRLDVTTDRLLLETGQIQRAVKPDVAVDDMK